ncbi:hypothetical protein AAMO2058_000230600 [Amorphochlora amoebiformis]
MSAHEGSKSISMMGRLGGFFEALGSILWPEQAEDVLISCMGKRVDACVGKIDGMRVAVGVPGGNIDQKDCDLDEERQTLITLIESFGEAKSTVAWVSDLESMGQAHVANALRQMTRENRLLLSKQLDVLDSQYSGGLRAYLANAKKLLLDSQMNVNAFQRLTPSPPTGVSLDPGSAEFEAMETL